MAYTIVQVDVTESQLSDLMRGVKIHLAKQQFSGDVSIPMTKAQATRIATATRGINLKMSGPQQKWLQENFAVNGEGIVGDIIKAAAPLARRGVDAGLDFLQSKIPTNKLGVFKGVADSAVGLGRTGANKLLDYFQKKLGGAAGQAACDARMGEGWFTDYLLPGLETAAKIAVPILRGGGNRKEYQRAIDVQLGSGWFSDFLLPALTTAAKIVTPLLGGGIQHKSYSGAGWFDQYLLPGLETAAKIAVPLIRGKGNGAGFQFLRGSGWEPMDQKKRHSAKGLFL
jgi:hypothetical protein